MQKHSFAHDALTVTGMVTATDNPPHPLHRLLRWSRRA